MDAKLGFARKFIVSYPIIFLILLFRQPHNILHPQLWAEDGAVFLNQGLRLPLISAIFTPYNGYILFLHRLIASFFSIYNVRYAPFAFNLIALMLMTFSIWIFMTDIFKHVLPLKHRIVVVLILCLLPWHSETFGCLTNVQWWLFFALALISLGNIECLNKFWKIALPVFVFAVVFSAPTSVLLIPVLAVRIYQNRSSRNYSFFLYTGTLVLIITNMVISKILASDSMPSLLSINYGYFVEYFSNSIGYRIISLNIFGKALSIHHLQKGFYHITFTVFFIVAAILYVRVLAASSSSFNISGIGLIYYIISPLVIIFFLRPSFVKYVVVEQGYGEGERYFFISSFFFVVFVIHFIHVGIKKAKYAKILLIVLSALYLMVVADNYRYPRYKDFKWNEHITKYYQLLLSEQKPREGEYHVPTHPKGWKVRLPLFSPTPEQKEKIKKLLN